MNEGWTTSRVVTVLMLAAVLFLGYTVLQSLDRQQEQIISLNKELQELRQVKIEIGGLDEIVVRHEGMPSYIPAPMMAPTGQGGMPSVPAQPQVSRKDQGDGKDAIGRPLAPTPGFDIFPPLDKEYPGRTFARTPDFIPELCGTYLQGQPSDPDKLNFYLTNSGITSTIDKYVHERLFTINPDDPSELVPHLAVAWETGHDKLTYRFHLRKGVKFSDGSPFTADDVIFSYNALKDPDVESEHLRSAYEKVESVRKIDDLTFEVRMREKYWKALKTFGYSLRILCSEFFEREIPAKAAELGIKTYSVTPQEPGFAEVFNKFDRIIPPGTGPYMFQSDSWVANESVTLYPFLDAWRRKMNPDYYRLEKLRWRFVGDQVARHEEFRKQNIDILGADHNSWEDNFSKDKTITSIANHYVYDHIGLLYSYLSFNNRRFPFNDKSVRRAMGHLMNRELILSQLERGNGKIATCFTKPIYPEYSHDIEPYEYNPQKALEILTAAGWSDSDGDGLLDKDGRALEFTFTTPSARTFFTTVTTLLQEACRSIGIRCKDDQKEWSLFVTDFYERDFDAVCLYSSASDPWLDPYDNFHSSQSGPRQGNHCGWVNERADEIMELMRDEFDDEKRAALFHELNHLFNEDLPMLLLIHGEVGVLLNKRIQGAKVRPTGLQPFDMWIDPKDVRE